MRTCDDNNPCTVDTCDPDKDPACVYTHVADNFFGCSAPTPECLSPEAGCVECTEHYHCEGYCDNIGSSPGYTCVECLDGTHCDDGDGCTADVCTTDGTCDNPYSCSGSTPVCYGGSCVECTSSSHCTPPNGCYTSTCTSSHTCRDTYACDTGEEYCSGGRCVSCNCPSGYVCTASGGCVDPGGGGGGGGGDPPP